MRILKIGLVGKPNVGKSTFFSAATLAKVDIANYPFCTIDANVGVAFIKARLPCPCKELREKLEGEGRIEPTAEDDPRHGSLCQPRTGDCVGHNRLVPVFLVDVAGLVPGASEGRGRGNAFLNDLSQSDALIQVVDAAGTTDIEGNPIGTGQSFEDASTRVSEEITFLENELDAWIQGLLEDGWARGVRRVQAEGEAGLISFLTERFSGINSNIQKIDSAFKRFTNQNSDLGQPWDWKSDVLGQLAKEIRKEIFPIHIAANKIDVAPDGIISAISANGKVIGCMSDMELALRRADEASIISYFSGDENFTITNPDALNDAQSKALAHMKEKLSNNHGTGISKILDTVVFDELNQIVVYPVQDETHWTDGEGKVLPDAFVVVDGIEARKCAYKVHSDLGDGFIKGIDGKTKRVVGADHCLSDGDVLKIHSKS